MARIDVTPIYENTTMQAYYNSENVLKSYYISPIEGYVLHVNSYDTEVIDEETGEPTGEIILGYIPYPAFTSVWHTYDFVTNPFNIYAVPQDTVPENQIFNNGGPEHEVASTEPNTETETE